MLINKCDDIIYEKVAEGTNVFNGVGLYSTPSSVLSLSSFVTLLNLFIMEYETNECSVEIDVENSGIRILMDVEIFDSFGDNSTFAQLAMASDAICFMSLVHENEDGVYYTTGIRFDLFDVWDSEVSYE